MKKNTFKAWMKKYKPSDLLLLTQGKGYELDGLRSYSDTTKLYAAYKEEIWAIVKSKAEKSGHATMMAWLATLTDVVLSEPETFEGYLVWCAAKEIATYLIQDKA